MTTGEQEVESQRNKNSLPNYSITSQNLQMDRQLQKTAEMG
jgi:hypothetical protein